jgi:hypothetical protein
MEADCSAETATIGVLTAYTVLSVTLAAAVGVVSLPACLPDCSTLCCSQRPPWMIGCMLAAGRPPGVSVSAAPRFRQSSMKLACMGRVASPSAVGVYELALETAASGLAAWRRRANRWCRASNGCRPWRCSGRRRRRRRDAWARSDVGAATGRREQGASELADSHA